MNMMIRVLHHLVTFGASFSIEASYSQRFYKSSQLRPNFHTLRIGHMTLIIQCMIDVTDLVNIGSV